MIEDRNLSNIYGYAKLEGIRTASVRPSVIVNLEIEREYVFITTPLARSLHSLFLRTHCRFGYC